MMRWDDDIQDQRARPLTRGEIIGAVLMFVFLAVVAFLQGW